MPTVRDRLREFECRHAAVVDDDRSGVKEKLETNRKEGGVSEEVEDVSSSDIDEEEVRGMRMDDKEEILGRVERDCFRWRIL